tara:strand:- start:3 stop:419 length:417 start_codon:yes stop_codon:yes gene_type:complete
MKLLIALFFLIGSTASFSQSEYTDTIYYKTGFIRAGVIFKESKTAIRYNYLNAKGKVMTTSARKSMLNKYTVGDKENSVAVDFTSPNLSSTMQSGGDSNTNNERKINAAGRLVVGRLLSIGVVAALTAGVIILVSAIF